MSTVVLSGAADPLGRRVAAALGRAPGVDRVITLDEHDLHGPDLKARIEGATALVHLAGGLDDTRAVLDTASSVGASQLVVLSSATVYGAWANNPVPLTEDAPLRPNPELDFAVRAAERERLASDWRHDHPGSTVAVLRPAVPVAEDAAGWLDRGMREASAIRAAGPDDPPGQFVHLDDLTAAVVVALTQRLDGPFNVSPDGWIEGDQLRALEGVPRLRVPEPIARRLAWLWSKVSPSSASAGLIAYTVHPWVVASDRLKAVGWSASFSNEEAYVAAHRPAPWATLSPQRRQELALGGLVALAGGLVVGVVALVRRGSSRRA
ncbi:MAG TPA: NAD-dependent epimerase/dehydratase family protein [Acidimicrobiales bacterium]|jgi:nucleoside-diphosphate-sugar epimerase|nr:NAD-dependent epimerase/dehydratase family protein [Acidimicrobiales bacterium]